MNAIDIRCFECYMMSIRFVLDCVKAAKYFGEYNWEGHIASQYNEYYLAYHLSKVLTHK